MRIEQIDIDGYGSLSGSFLFPDGVLGLWCTPNDTGKSSLPAALGAALYGPPPSGEAEPASGWIMLRFTTDDGVPLVVARDLTAGTVQVTDATGNDVTPRYHDEETSIGERILGMTRCEFRTLTRNDLLSVRDTVGDRVLLSLLGHGRGPESGSSVGSAPGAVDGGAGPEPPGVAEEDLQIFRSAAEELGYAPPVDPDATVIVGPDGPPGEPADLATLESETDGQVLLRRLRDGLHTLDQRFTAAQDDYRAWNLRMQELQAESDRLGTLSGAEPADVEKLGALLDLLHKIQDRREKLRRDEEAFRRDLQSRDVDTEALAELEALFRAMSEEELRFLETFRQAETILRGNQALVRSESRLDEAQLVEIERSRRDAARMASGPLFVSILGLFGSILFHLVPSLPLPLPPSLFLALGLLGATAGAWLLWRARHLREDERRGLRETQQRKNAQLEAFDEEESDGLGRLTALAASYQIEPATKLVDRHASWIESKAEIRQLDAFSRRKEEIDRELATVREKLGSFAPAENPDIDPEDLENMLGDYRRYFEVQEELNQANLKGADQEEKLADLEREQAAFRERIGEILTAAGIDPEHNLDEAIEIHARRAGNGLNPTAPAVTDTTGPASDPAQPVAAAPSGPEPVPAAESFDAGSTAWISIVSARAEEIARQLIPDIREVEVDAGLAPHVRFAESGPRLAWDELRPRLSAAVLDQLCLAVRLAIVETVSSVGERIPVLLDDPLLRADDARHARAMQFLVEDAGARGQVVLLTAHEVRTRWFLHQNPRYKDLVRPLREEAGASAPVSSPSS